MHVPTGAGGSGAPSLRVWLGGEETVGGTAVDPGALMNEVFHPFTNAPSSTKTVQGRGLNKV